MRKDRLKTYMSCWCMSDCDLDLMWKGYVHNPPGISIKSSLRRLKDICDKAVEYWPLDISTITYVDQTGGKNINYFGTPTYSKTILDGIKDAVSKNTKVHYFKGTNLTDNDTIFDVIDSEMFQGKIIAE